ncbi:MAG: hypothetical protein K6U80_11710 [Firmicutes bacterium]|nr:hypothetical protein [Bacillota bacterium]
MLQSNLNFPHDYTHPALLKGGGPKNSQTWLNQGDFTSGILPEELFNKFSFSGSVLQDDFGPQSDSGKPLSQWANAGTRNRLYIRLKPGEPLTAGFYPGLQMVLIILAPN